MYTVYQKRIKNTDLWSYRYCKERAILVWHLYNAALLRIRQIFTGWGKVTRTLNEQEVFMEVSALEASYPSIHIKKVISYSHLEKLMRVTNNPDFFSVMIKSRNPLTLVRGFPLLKVIELRMRSFI